MFTAMIVDDERPALDLLRRLLENTGLISVVGAFASAAEALAQAQNLKADVAFLDIMMPDMSGLELAERINAMGGDTEIVFVTAYDKYAVEAFRVNAIDYILKPFSPEDIAQVISRLKKVKPRADRPRQPADKGRIYCFRRLLVYGPGCGEPVKWRTSKAKELFAFMLQNLNRKVARWKIAQVLWLECETDSRLNTHFYTTVYKMKQNLRAAKIEFDFSYVSGSYKLELPGVYIDTLEFNEILKRKAALSSATVENYLKAFGLYKGNYLEENEYSWAEGKAEEYLKSYCDLAMDLAGYFEKSADYAGAEKILRESLISAPLNDDLNEMLLRLLLLKGEKASLVVQYRKIKDMYEAELGITPRATMQNIFRRASDL